MHLKKSSAKCRPFCLGLMWYNDVLHLYHANIRNIKVLIHLKIIFYHHFIIVYDIRVCGPSMTFELKHKGFHAGIWPWLENRDHSVKAPVKPIHKVELTLICFLAVGFSGDYPACRHHCFLTHAGRYGSWWDFRENIFPYILQYKGQFLVLVFHRM